MKTIALAMGLLLMACAAPTPVTESDRDKFMSHLGGNLSRCETTLGDTGIAPDEVSPKCSCLKRVLRQEISDETVRYVLANPTMSEVPAMTMDRFVADMQRAAQLAFRSCGVPIPVADGR